MNRRWLRRSLVVLITAAVVAPTAAYATHVFDDVEDDFVHAPGIEYVADKGITTGCDANNYCPNNPLTRGQMATFLYRASGNAPGIAPSVNADTVDGLDSTELGGAVGPTGPEGPPGPPGTPGTNGTNGTDGTDGSPNPFAIATGTAAITTISGLGDLAGSSTAVVVPAGSQAVISAEFSAETACSGGSGYCLAQILVDGTPMAPNAGTDFAFDSTDGSTETGGSWESHSMQRVSAVVPAGSHTVTVQVGTTINTTSLRVDDWTLFIEAHLVP